MLVSYISKGKSIPSCLADINVSDCRYHSQNIGRVVIMSCLPSLKLIQAKFSLFHSFLRNWWLLKFLWNQSPRKGSQMRLYAHGLFNSSGLKWQENYHIRLESGEFLILGHEEVPLGYFYKPLYSTIISNHFQKFQKFKDSSLFWWPKITALKVFDEAWTTKVKSWLTVS